MKFFKNIFFTELEFFLIFLLLFAASSGLTIDNTYLTRVMYFFMPLFLLFLLLLIHNVLEFLFFLFHVERNSCSEVFFWKNTFIYFYSISSWCWWVFFLIEYFTKLIFLCHKTRLSGKKINSNLIKVTQVNDEKINFNFNRRSSCWNK